jgi:two-component system LytT family response regulator
MKLSPHLLTGKTISLLNRKVIIAAILLLLLLSSLQDFLETTFLNGSFYLGESLLFRSFWIFFPFLIYIQIRFLRQFTAVSLTKRIVLAITSIAVLTLLHAAIHAMAIYLYSKFFMDHVYTPGKTFFYTITEDFLKYLLFYTATAIAVFWKAPQTEQPSQQTVLPDSLIISSGSQKIIVPVTDIQVITASPPYCVLQTADKKHFHSTTLKSLAAQLPPATFIRVHKSAIVNLAFVKSLKSRGNGDYDITMQNDNIVRLSRNYAGAFKSSGLIHSA